MVVLKNIYCIVYLTKVKDSTGFKLKIECKQLLKLVKISMNYIIRNNSHNLSLDMRVTD